MRKITRTFTGLAAAALAVGMAGPALAATQGLRFPAGSLNVTPNALYFTAGINHEADGLLGDIVAAQS